MFTQSKIIMHLAMAALLTVLLSACGSSGSSTNSDYNEAYLHFYNGSPNGATVYMREVDGSDLGYAQFGDASALISGEKGDLELEFYRIDSDDQEVVIDTITAGGKMDAPVIQRVFWCTLEGLVAIALLLGGGLSALQGAAVSTGIPFMGVQQDGGHELFLRRLEKVMAKTAGVRRWGDASLDLAYVAAGRYDGFWERGLSPWDVAAGLIIVKEAGGFVTDSQGRKYKYETKDIVASNDKIHSSLLDLLRSAK